jgi:hypothetical protein
MLGVGIEQSVQWLATGWTTEGSEFVCRWGKNFLFSKSSRLALWFIQPPIQWVPGALSSGLKQQEREADHSPPTSAEVETKVGRSNEW